MIYVHSGVPTMLRHGLALTASLQLNKPVHLVLDAPWGYALWGMGEMVHPVLILTGRTSDYYLRDLLERNPEALIADEVGPEDVQEGLARVAKGEHFYRSPNLSENRLTPRERDVLRLMAWGKSDVEIARALGVKKQRVYNLISSVLAKLELENRVQAVHFYFGLSNYVRASGC